MSSPYKCYCGPFWMPKFFRRFLSIPFNAACRLHDMHYGQKIGRKKADRLFLTNMLRLIREKDKKPKFVYIPLAYVFYLSVRIGGWISYR